MKVKARRACRLALCGTMASVINTAALAQYVYNPNNADEGPGIRYFGSAKDDNGALLPDVSIQIIGNNLTYMLITDAQGRYRQLVPLGMDTQKTTVRCFKAGYELVRLNKRLGPSAPKQTVQADCILRSVNPK